MLNIRQVGKQALCALWIIAIILCGLLLLRLPVKPDVYSPASESQPIKWPVTQGPSDAGLSSLSTTQHLLKQSTTANRYRLAGTFLQLSDTPGSEQRLAILDDLELSRQYLMSEGDREGALEVVRVEQNRVEILDQGLRKILELSFQTTSSTPPVKTEPKPESKTADFASMPALETTAFGKRVATNQWVFKREALLGYYNEMMDNPERLANLYMSFRPDYNAAEEIGGYHLDPMGEQNFLSEMGMLEGDVVRKVNSLEMTSQRRAEYFIGTFARDELNAVVLDIEREGKAQKLIYMIR